MEEERKVNITLEQAQMLYEQGGEFRKIAIEAFSEEEILIGPLPKSWEEFCTRFALKKEEVHILRDGQIVPIEDKSVGGYRPYSDLTILPNRKAAEQLIAMMMLQQLRDCYRNGWEPDYYDMNVKYTICSVAHNIVVRENIDSFRFLTFQTEKLAREFRNNFLGLIAKAGDLI